MQMRVLRENSYFLFLNNKLPMHVDLVRTQARIRSDRRGGIWGMLFLVPLRKYIKSWWLRAFIFGMHSALSLNELTLHAHVL
jgi:hypothetical protein